MCSISKDQKYFATCYIWWGGTYICQPSNAFIVNQVLENYFQYHNVHVQEH